MHGWAQRPRHQESRPTGEALGAAVGPGNARAPETAAARGLRAASPKRDWDLLPGECTIKDMIHCLTRCLLTGEIKALRSGRVNLHSICCTQRSEDQAGLLGT